MLKQPDSKDQLVAEQAQLIAEQVDYIAELEERVAELKARVEELEARLRQNSTNSSRPPSSDPPDVQRKKTGNKTLAEKKRKRGAQVGHKAHQRELLPPDQVTRVVPLVPEQCGECSKKLDGKNASSPTRHQVIELPEIQPDVTEFQCYEAMCSCGAKTRAKLPDGVPRGMFGPRLCGLVGVLTGKFRMAKRATAEMLSDVLGIDVCLGSICKMEQIVSKAVASPVEEAREFVRNQPVVHLDETSWAEANEKAWLWTAVTAAVAVFTISPTRSADVAKDMLGSDFSGILVSDRYSAYNWVPSAQRQVCWAHLLRDFESMVDRGGKAAMYGNAILVWAGHMFHWWHQVGEGALSRQDFQTNMEEVKTAVGDNLRMAAADDDVPKTIRGKCNEILKLESAMWTFVDYEGVEPTNNTAEQTLRPSVIWRKCSFGTQSERGSRYAERILSVVATLKRQGRHVLDYLTSAVEAHFHAAPAPSLLPDTS